MVASNQDLAGKDRGSRLLLLLCGSLFPFVVAVAMLNWEKGFSVALKNLPSWLCAY